MPSTKKLPSESEIQQTLLASYRRGRMAVLVTTVVIIVVLLEGGILYRQLPSQIPTGFGGDSLTTLRPDDFLAKSPLTAFAYVIPALGGLLIVGVGTLMIIGWSGKSLCLAHQVGSPWKQLARLPSAEFTHYFIAWLSSWLAIQQHTIWQALLQRQVVSLMPFAVATLPLIPASIVIIVWTRMRRHRLEAMFAKE